MPLKPGFDFVVGQESDVTGMGDCQDLPVPEKS